MMTFGKMRKALGNAHVEREYELLRFCNKKNTTVIGGASKMLSFFISEYDPRKITSYADRRWSAGNVYEKLGFVNVKTTPPNYWYVIQQTRHHRFAYRKDKLVSAGYDAAMTEFEIMLMRKIYKIWDCGSFKYELSVS